MNLLHTILSKLADNYFDKNSDAILSAMQKVNEGDNEDISETVSEDEVEKRLNEKIEKEW